MRSIWHYMMYSYSEQWKPGNIPDRPLMQISHPLTKYSRGKHYMDVEKPTARGNGAQSFASGSGNVGVDHTGYDDHGKKP